MAYLNTLDLRTYPKDDGKNVFVLWIMSVMLPSTVACFPLFSEQRIPTQWIMAPLSFFTTGCGFLFFLFISKVSLRFWCKGHLKAMVTPHGGVNSDSKGRKLPATLIWWPLRPVFPLLWPCLMGTGTFSRMGLVMTGRVFIRNTTTFGCKSVGS